jgi:iron(II)-dependent oxidoreductase
MVLALIGLLLAACAPPEEPVATQAASQATPAFKTPLPEADQAQRVPTNTPMPPPSTPTPRPTNTPALIPTPSAAETEAATAGPADTPAPAAAPVTQDMVEIPAGAFTMGSDDSDPEDAPAHAVDLPAYQIDRFEVTNADFAAFVDATGYTTDAEKADKKSWREDFAEGKETHPVTRVTWNDATAYCEWLGKRLPTEAEWEKAARGAEGLRFPWGNEADPSKANVKATGLRGTAAVGSFGAGASPYGVEDMAGNVWEWTADWYQAYAGNTTGDPYYGEQCRATRGGGWFDEEPQLTTFNRNCSDPNQAASDELGFRCAISR